MDDRRFDAIARKLATSSSRRVALKGLLGIGVVVAGLTGYEHDKGDGLWRRSLYTFWKRTVLSPTMQVFDASAREFCTVRDTRTNTPLQSLTLLNDEAAMEMARALAKRMFLEVEGDAKARLEYGFRLCTGRRPKAAELDRLTALYAQQLANYKAAPLTADQLLKGENRELPAPELAAWTLVANVLLNLDETLTKQ